MTTGSNPSTGRVQTTIASAGTGKTYNVVSAIAAAIEADTPPERILATTFTVKAADELVERARARLIQMGRMSEATRLLGARMGTVNGVCGRLVGEFAFDLGRSPWIDVIAEKEQPRIFTIAADKAITAHAVDLNTLSDLFGLAEGRPEDRTDWRDLVRAIIALARVNGLGAPDLAISADRSVSSFLDVLPTPEEHEYPALFNQNLAAAVDALLADVPIGDIGRDTEAAIETARRAKAYLSRSEVPPWHLWAKLSKVKAAKKAGTLANDRINVIAAAAQVHPRHPRLREDTERFIRELFSCAADAFEAYQEFKDERGLVDFVDQETLALHILTRPDLKNRLCECIGQVFVDEFQDSSPLQIAIFTALVGIAERSTWVGDPKQSIYGFRDADASLTLAAFHGAAQESGIEPEVLSESRRSRRGIIEFLNDAFGQTFEAMGLPASENAFSGTARDETGLSGSPLSVWHAPARKLADRALEIAAGVQAALTQPEEWLVGAIGGARPLRAGDIAILCRTKPRVALVAAALSELGIKVAVERVGLVNMPEAELVFASLRWVADLTDRLALAEIARLIGGTEDPALWLRAVLAEEQGQALEAAVPFASELRMLRERQLSLTPSEILDAITGTSGVRAFIDRLGNPAARLDNLEAIRGLARAYEGECSRFAVPATAGGLVLWLASETPAQPRSLDPDAVKVMTYHGAKGLEWPMVVLTDLEEVVKENVFGVAAEVEGTIDWRSPLAGRWIRFWPWPYGAQKKDVALDALAANSSIGQRAKYKAQEEEIRLLYVGAARARDQLVLIKAGSSAAHKLELLTNAEGTPHVQLPSAGQTSIVIGANNHEARVIDLSSLVPELHDTVEMTHVSLERHTVDRPSLFVRPSDIQEGEGYRVARVTEFGARVAITGDPDMTVLGEAVHAVLAADRAGSPREKRTEKARRILERWGTMEVTASDIIAAADRFNEHLANEFAGARIQREIPVIARLGNQILSGRVDVLVGGEDWFVVIDHKSFPGGRERREAAALSYAPQLHQYAEGVRIASGRECRGLFIHMPISGAILEIEVGS